MVDSRKRKSDQLDLEATIETNLNTITQLTVVFKDKDNRLQEEYHIFHNDPVTIFDDDAEEATTFDFNLIFIEPFLWYFMTL